MTDEAVRLRRRCCLYRHFDADGVLLYVGISSDPGHRTFEHSVGAGRRWVNYASRMEGVWYASTEAARAAELIAIRHEAPVFNSANRSSHAESEARKRAYEQSHVPLAVPGEHVPPRLTRAEATEAVRQQILARDLPPGEKMTPIPALAVELDIGHERARLVVETLVKEGWLEKPRFRGPCFVTRTLPPVPPSAERLAVLRGSGYKPAHEVIAERLRAQIESGQLAPGDQIPSLSELAKSATTSIKSAQLAVGLLRVDGLVATRKGQRTRVLPSGRAALEAAS